VRTTSLRAYHEIKASGLLSGLLWVIYDLLFTNGPLTQNETHRLLAGQHGFGNKPTITPRFAELERKGVVVPVGKRFCAVSGNVCLAYDVTAHLPDNRPRKKRPCEIIAALNREIARLTRANEELTRRLCRWGRPSNAERQRRKAEQARHPMLIQT
jgi:hypothetical protein